MEGNNSWAESVSNNCVSTFCDVRLAQLHVGFSREPPLVCCEIQSSVKHPFWAAKNPTQAARTLVVAMRSSC